jgi:isoquinoline 1-oxidoreductase alpha subunit
MTRFTVNGQAVHYRLDPETPLLWALRDASNLTGTKYGCGTGHCGACTVHVDGRATLSCQVSIAELEGSIVTTIEGLSPNRSHPVQQAWAEASVSQCGFCQPGIIMAAAALFGSGARPSDSELDSALGNLCRCGTTARVREAFRRAYDIAHEGAQAAGAPPPRVDPAEAARQAPSLRPPPAPRRRGPSP